jgi:hypothetical protein
MEPTVFREQMINFLGVAVVFLLITNALSIAATTCAIQLLSRFSGAEREQGIIERKLWRELRKGFIDSYRPELHYMRGPGPKWREKHDAAQVTRSGAVGAASQGAAA